jgi:Zn-dependent protease with chaperone function
MPTKKKEMSKRGQVYKQISSKAYEHPADRAATSSLHAVPLLDQVIKRLTDLGHERQLRQIVTGSAIQVGENQLPQIWAEHTWCGKVLDLEDVPNLYVVGNPEVNAMTIGANTPMVVTNSSMIGSYSNEEIGAVLAHENGHVLSQHYQYTTALILLAQFMEGALPRSLLLGLPVRAMYMALLEWHRAAELSSDRAAALVTRDPLAPCRVLMRLAGGTVEGLNFDAFLQQSNDYHEEEDLFSRHSRFWLELKLTHPFAVRRVRQLIEWVQSGEYDRIVAGQYVRRGDEAPPSAEFSAAVAHYRQRFSRFLERATGDVKSFGTQIGDWLRQKVPNASDESG